MIHEYSWKPIPQFKMNAADMEQPTANQMFMGVELEVETRGQDQYAAERQYALEFPDDFTYQKADGSISLGGFEVVSHPATLKFHMEDGQWDKRLKKLTSIGGRSHQSNNCGLHVHVNKSYLTTNDRVKLGLFVHINKARMENFSRRVHGHYYKYKTISPTANPGQTRPYATQVINGRDRYEAINYLNRHTIEFRMFKGTLKKKTFYATLQMVHALVHFIKVTSTRTIIDADKAWNQFCQFVRVHMAVYDSLANYLAERQLWMGRTREMTETESSATRTRTTRTRTTGRQTIGAYVVAELRRDSTVSNDALALRVRELFNSRTTPQCISWYRSNMRRHPEEYPE